MKTSYFLKFILIALFCTAAAQSLAAKKGQEPVSSRDYCAQLLGDQIKVSLTGSEPEFNIRDMRIPDYGVRLLSIFSASNTITGQKVRGIALESSVSTLAQVEQSIKNYEATYIKFHRWMATQLQLMEVSFRKMKAAHEAGELSTEDISAIRYNVPMRVQDIGEQMEIMKNHIPRNLKVVVSESADPFSVDAPAATNSGLGFLSLDESGAADDIMTKERLAESLIEPMLALEEPRYYYLVELYRTMHQAHLELLGAFNPSEKDDNGGLSL